jgi:hypothetical protein
MAWALLLGAALTPAAIADTEPNGAVFMPEGPIAGGQDVEGTVDGGDTDDWYVFHVEGVHQLHLTWSQVPPRDVSASYPACLEVELTNANGSPIPPDFTSRPGTSTFHVHVSQRDYQFCPSPTRYRFRVDPAEAVVSGPGRLPVKGTAEPNDSRGSAGGPLAPGAWYHSELETVNDEDWLRLYVRPGTRRVDVQTVVYGPWCASHEVTLRSARGAELASYTGMSETVIHLTHRTRGGARLYVQIANGASSSLSSSGCVHSATVLQVAPEEAIMSAAEVRKGCRDGRAARRRSARRVAVRRRAVVRAKARGLETAKLRRQLKRDRRALKRSRGLVSAYCSR